MPDDGSPGGKAATSRQVAALQEMTLESSGHCTGLLSVLTELFEEAAGGGIVGGKVEAGFEGFDGFGGASEARQGLPELEVEDGFLRPGFDRASKPDDGVFYIAGLEVGER